MGVVDELAERVERMAGARARPRVLVGIAGAPGAGKTTLAVALAARLGGFPRVAHVPMDGFHLADIELARLHRTDRKGAPDTFDAAGYAALLQRIGRGEQVWAPAFERGLEQPVAQSIPVVDDTAIVISEGNYLLLADVHWPRARAEFDEVWFVREDETERVRRLIARHVQFGKTPEDAAAWVQRTDAANAELVAQTAATADLIIDLRKV